MINFNIIAIVLAYALCICVRTHATPVRQIRSVGSCKATGNEATFGGWCSLYNSQMLCSPTFVSTYCKWVFENEENPTPEKAGCFSATTPNLDAWCSAYSSPDLCKPSITGDFCVWKDPEPNRQKCFNINDCTDDPYNTVCDTSNRDQFTGEAECKLIEGCSGEPDSVFVSGAPDWFFLGQMWSLNGAWVKDANNPVDVSVTYPQYRKFIYGVLPQQQVEFVLYTFKSGSFQPGWTFNAKGLGSLWMFHSLDGFVEPTAATTWEFQGNSGSAQCNSPSDELCYSSTDLSQLRISCV
eukprot:Awhi_evm1s13884